MTDPRAARDREIEALAALLDSTGADRTRWPAPDRLRFAALIASDPEAQRLLREAEALDRLLDLAPAPGSAETNALADRIMASLAAGEARPEVPGIAARAREADSAKPGIAAPPSGRAAVIRAQPPPRRSPDTWKAAMLLAASLVIGIFAGTSTFMQDAVLPLVGAAEDVEVDLTQVGLDGDSATLLEEGLL